MKFQADIEGSTKRLCWWIGCGVCEKEIFGLNTWRGGEATELGSMGGAGFGGQPGVSDAPIFSLSLFMAPSRGVWWTVGGVHLEFRGETCARKIHFGVSGG